MKIGIIGAGFIGRAVAQLALAAGHEVMLSNSRGPQSMSSVLSGIRGVQVGTAQDAAQFGELVLLAIPFEHYRSVPAQCVEPMRTASPIPRLISSTRRRMNVRMRISPSSASV